MPHNNKRKRQAKSTPTNPSKKPRRRRSTKPKPGDVQNWPPQVWELFRAKLQKNLNQKNQPYYKKVPLIPQGEDGPPALKDEKCFVTLGSPSITVTYQGIEYQRRIHRLFFILAQIDAGRGVPSNKVQASHLCPDEINEDGRGIRHCCNPDHMTAENDTRNKSRQRCCGWIWIFSYEGRRGGYWYPQCIHRGKPCLRYTKPTIPTAFLLSPSKLCQ